MAAVQVFLSTVSAEFRSYRDALRKDLDRHNLTVKVQEDFIAHGGVTLDKLDDYIRECHAIIRGATGHRSVSLKALGPAGSSRRGDQAGQPAVRQPRDSVQRTCRHPRGNNETTGPVFLRPA